MHSENRSQQVVHEDKDSAEAQFLQLNPREVYDCFENDLVPIQPDNVAVSKFCDYILNNYIADDPRFPPAYSVGRRSTLSQLQEQHILANHSVQS